jgi:zinc protease
MKKIFGDIHNSVLKNGLQVIINSDHAVPKVSIQLWYNVGSKDERSGQKGLAHLLEHMIFKGTRRLSESDINMITSKLSGYTNAFTSYDYTGYLFDFPKQHWQVALDMLSDCMTNCTFNEDMLQSELKAVIQELKLYKDDYSSSLIEAMVANIFSDHPYHHPIIGYKQDLWSITREGLLQFYRKYYCPNNATLVITGDVDPVEVQKEIEFYFGSIPKIKEEPRAVHYAAEDIKPTGVILYRDVQRSQLLYAWRIPGAQAKEDFLTSVIAYIMGESKSSILYKRLVDDLCLATNVQMYVDDMFEHGLLFLHIEPVEDGFKSEIEAEIKHVIEGLQKDGVSYEQVSRAMKQVQTDYLVQTESLQERAYIIGKAFLATGDAHYINNYLQFDEEMIKARAIDFLKKYMRISVMHKGVVAPLPESEKEHWIALQSESDRTDAVILSRKDRQTPVELGKFVESIHAKDPVAFNVPEHQKIILDNGLSLLYYKTSGLKIEVQIEFDVQYYHDPDHLQGLGSFVFALMQEGTKNYTKEALMDAIASKGMQLDIGLSYISLTLLKDDLQYGLSLLSDIIEHSLFDDEAIEKVRTQILSEITDYWDSPNDFVGQLVREHIYKNHPYSKNYLGTEESVENITRDDIIVYYKKHITPVHARIAIVGAYDANIKELVSRVFGSWSGNKIQDIDFPILPAPSSQEIVYPIVRDQVVLVLAGLSVDYHSQLYDALLLFDQIFTGGAQRSMSSQLFQLREQTGLFYSIGGSLVLNASKQPGMFYIKTMVSQDRLSEAEQAIKETIKLATDRVTDDDFLMAKNAIAHQLIDQFATQKGAIESFLFIERMGLPRDYFKDRMQHIARITKNEMIDAVKQILNLEHISIFKVGRF